jgi:hypothetical protein
MLEMIELGLGARPSPAILIQSLHLGLMHNMPSPLEADRLPHEPRNGTVLHPHVVHPKAEHAILLCHGDSTGVRLPSEMVIDGTGRVALAYTAPSPHLLGGNSASMLTSSKTRRIK